MNPKASLSHLAGNRYKIVLEESWHHERPEVRRTNRRWYEMIPCRHDGFIMLYAEKPTIVLQFYTTRVKNARHIWKEIKSHPGCKADFHFDGEAVLYFPLELIHQVAEKAGAKVKRRLSPEARRKLVERTKVYQFQPQKRAVGSEKMTQSEAFRVEVGP
jgi:hypothetical protein